MLDDVWKKWRRPECRGTLLEYTASNRRSMSERRKAQELDFAAATVRVPMHVVYRTFAQETVVLNLIPGDTTG